EYVDLKWQSADGVELDFGTWKGSRAEWLSLYFEANIEEPVKLIEAIKSTSLYDEKLHFERTDPNGSWIQLFYIVKENRIFYIQIYASGYIEMDSLLNRDTQFYYSGSEHMLCAMAHWLRETDVNGHYTGLNCYVWDTILFPITIEDLKYLYGKLDDSLYEIDGETIYVKCFAETVSENKNTGLYERSYALDDNYYAAIFQNDAGRISIRLVDADKKMVYAEPEQ
ncbi:MAG: hypothetical protein II739_01840, partial [Clostridia bacterium]|nr:hypothetical protein [Clostridia bacterium]